MNWRIIGSVAVGLAVSVFLFFAVGIGFGFIWPEYREAARMMFEENDMSGYTTGLLLLNWVLFIVNGIVVGLVTGIVGRSRLPALILASLMLVLMVINHYVLEWDSFPAWYNLIVPLIIAGSIVLGGRLRTRKESAATSAATTA